jgi:FtsP/CotA-like multicopper oxidase with cupredoxin domain
MQAKRAVYRWRLVNGANTRYFKLRLTTRTDPTTKIGFHIIGTDGGLLPAALPLDELVLAPGERADLLVDLTHHAGAELILRNSADIPYPGDPTLANAGFPCDELLRILVTGAMVAGQNKFKPAPFGSLALPVRVDPLSGGDLAGIVSNSDIEAAIKTKLLATEGAAGSILPVEHLGLVTAGANPLTFNYRRFVLEEYQLLMPTLDGVLAPPNALGVVDFTNQTIPTVMVNGADMKTAKPVVTNKDAYEVWEFVNFTPDSHPMHIHLVQFRVLSRIQVNMADPAGQSVDDDPTRTPVSPGLLEPKRALGYNYAAATVVQPYEAQGWKDTAQCEPGQATRMLMRFDGYSGEYVYHCHILEHEDMGMMFNLVVEP